MNKKRKAPSWQFVEAEHTGLDFTNRKIVAAYDVRHRKFRDVTKENEAIIAAVGLKRTHVVADFGCGTGAFVAQAAQKCAKVYAVDISNAMLDYTRWKARKQGLRNVVYCHAGFLTYKHKGKPLDAIVTSAALHHLPDFWKQKALRRLNGMLRKGGMLFLADVVFSEERCEANIEKWIRKMGRKVGPEMLKDASHHVRQEHSTYTWIMEGLLKRAGFRIDRAIYSDGVLATYLCTKR